MEHGKPFSGTDSPLVDFDAVCQKVRAAVEPARAHAVSLHDEQGDVLWLSESSMGPDEHNAVREAIETFSHPGASPVLVHDLGDSRSAVLLRAVNSRRAMVGAIMIVMDARVVKQDARGALKVMTPKLQRVLADFSAMRPDIDPPADAQARAPAAASLTLVNDAPAPRPAAAHPSPPPAQRNGAATPAMRPPARRARRSAYRTVARSCRSHPDRGRSSTRYSPGQGACACAGPVGSRAGATRRGRRGRRGGQRVREQTPARSSDPRDRSAARRFAPQSHCVARATFGSVDQGKSAQTL